MKHFCSRNSYFLTLAVIFCLLLGSSLSPAQLFAAPENPVIFVGQVPFVNDFGKVTAPFSNQLASMKAAPRGGGLFIRYPDGSVTSLTGELGYGNPGLQSGENAIAVRDPCMHPGGQKVLFSMVVGAPELPTQSAIYHWQLYEISGLGKGQTRTITRVANQPPDYNNIMPFYGADGSIHFVSDRPRDGAPHLYPLLGEKESAPANTGIWKINKSSGAIEVVLYSPSGVFSPFIDSRGKIVFSRSDFLQRDQQADTDTYGAFNYSNESIAAVAQYDDKKEFFPEALPDSNTVPYENGHAFAYQFPWEIHSDGSGLTSLFGIGRHELLNYFEASINNDPAVDTFLVQFSTRATQKSVHGLIHVKESHTPGTYLGTNALPYTYNTHSAGQIVAATPDQLNGPQGLRLEGITSEETATVTTAPTASHTGLYRDPLQLINGEFIAAHTDNHQPNVNYGSDQFPDPAYDFRIRGLVQSGSIWKAGSYLTGVNGIQVEISYYDPDIEVSYTGPLWELQPVEVITSGAKKISHPEIAQPESALFTRENVSLAEFQQYLTESDLALLVVRDTTSRDRTDYQQPFNLQVQDTHHTTSGDDGRVYPIAALQIFQADQVRGYLRPKGDGSSEVNLSNGRRVLPVPLHAGPKTPLKSSIAPGSVTVQRDGSVAALVPANRPITWQLLDSSGKAIVRERYWFNLKAGEIAACGSCHPAANLNQTGAPEPDHEAIALRSILRWWKGEPLYDLSNYAFDVRGTKKRKKITATSFKSQKLYAKRAFQIEVSPLSGDANFEDLSINLIVNKKRCALPIAKFQTETNGYKLLQGIAPRIPRRRVKLQFELLRGSDTLLTQSAKLIRRNFPRERNRPVRGRRLKKLCSQMLPF